MSFLVALPGIRRPSRGPHPPRGGDGRSGAAPAHAPKQPVPGAAHAAGGGEQAFAHFGISAIWTDTLFRAEVAAWSICLVEAQLLQPARYPAGWLPAADAPNHFILWLPCLEGQTNWFDDPLVQDADCQYDLGSVASAFAGAYILPEPGPRTRFVRVPCALKVNPNHTCKALAMLRGGELASWLDAGGGWSKITARIEVQ